MFGLTVLGIAYTFAGAGLQAGMHLWGDSARLLYTTVFPVHSLGVSLCKAGKPVAKEVWEYLNKEENFFG